MPSHVFARPFGRVVPLLALLSAGALGAQAPAPRDPATPYGSWGEAARETAAAIAGVVLAQPADGRYEVGDAVVVDDGGKRYRAHVLAAQPERYEVHYDGFGAASKRFFSTAQLLGFQPGFVPAPRSAAGPAPAPAAAAAAPATGRYGCIESQYRVVSGQLEIEPRGSFTLAANGAYEYPGMQSRGRWRWNAAQGAIEFQGGFFDGARALRIDGGPKLRLELPTNDPKRPRKWSCGPS